MQKRMLVHWVHPLKSEKAIYRDLPQFTLIGPEQQLSTSKETGEELRTWYKKLVSGVASMATTEKNSNGGEI